jgi:hypothetical protein
MTILMRIPPEDGHTTETCSGFRLKMVTQLKHVAIIIE